MPRRISNQCAWVSTKPGTIVLPRTSKLRAPAGTLPLRRLAAHGDDSRAAQHDCALWRFARHLNDCLDLLDVRGLLFLLLLGGLVSGHLLLRGALPLVRLRTARRSLVSLSVLLLFVRFFLLVLFLGRLEG